MKLSVLFGKPGCALERFGFCYCGFFRTSIFFNDASRDWMFEAPIGTILCFLTKDCMFERKSVTFVVFIFGGWILAGTSSPKDSMDSIELIDDWWFWTWEHTLGLILGLFRLLDWGRCFKSFWVALNRNRGWETPLWSLVLGVWKDNWVSGCLCTKFGIVILVLILG